MKILKKTDIKLSEINSKIKGYGLYECYIEKWNNGNRYNVVLGTFNGEITEVRRKAYYDLKVATKETIDNLRCVCTYGNYKGCITKNNRPF